MNSISIAAWTSRDSRSLLILLVLVAGATPGVRAQPSLSDRERAALADLGPTFARELTLRRGWFRDLPITYYDVGVMEMVTGTVTVPVRTDSAGRPRLAPDARPVFSTVPGMPGYSGVWLVQYLLLPEKMNASEIRDARTATTLVLRGHATFRVPRLYVNLPILPAGSFLADDTTGRTLQRGWYKGVAVPYLDFGVTDLSIAPIFSVVRGISSDGPRFVREQHNIVDIVPGEMPDYTDIWDVRFVVVDDRFIPQAWRNMQALTTGSRVGGYRILPAGELRNCPVVTLGGKIAARTPVPW